MAAAALDQARYKGMLESLQQQDPDINSIVIYSKFVVAYMLHQDGPNPGWRKANIEGPVYLVRRRTLPKYQLLVKNQFSTTDLLDIVHPDWELDCQKNYVFYKIEDPGQRIRGLWFHDDAERQKLEAKLEQTLQELRTKPQEPEPQPLAQAPPQGHGFADPYGRGSAPLAAAPCGAMGGMGAPQGMGGSMGGAMPQERVPVSRESLKMAVHALADDDMFLNAVMQKLKDSTL